MTCTKCKIDKEPASFRREASCALGYRTDCKNCEAVYNASRPKRPVTPERRVATREAQRRYRDRLRARGIIKSPHRRRSPGARPTRQYRPRQIRLDPVERKAREAERKRSPHSRTLNKLRKYRRKHAEGSFNLTDIETLRRLQEDRCAYCGVVLVERTIDHVVPLSKNGTNHPWNLLLACVFCNKSKGTKMLDRWQLDRGFTLLPLTMISNQLARD